MPRLLQINITANWGSTGKIVESIGKSAAECGWESYVAYGRWCNPSESQVFKIGNNLDMYLHYAEQRIFDNEGQCSRGTTKRLIRKIEEIKPDIIQLHNIHDHYLNYPILFKYLNASDIKTVWTFHDCWAFTGHCFHFVGANCYRWRKECYNCPLRSSYPHTLLDRSKRNFHIKKQLFQANNNLTIVPCSHWMEGFVKESFLSEKPTEVINNGIDLNVFNVLPTKKESGTSFKILAVSSVWTSLKGIDDIYKLRKRLSSNYEITVVGLSSKQLKNIPSGIKGIERTQNVHDLISLYNESDVLINPTYADTFPTINLEALACGTPVITYRTGGSPETIDSMTGIIVEQGDIQALAEAIKQIEEAKEIGDKRFSVSECRKRAEENFNKDNCYKKYLDLYNKILAENNT